LATGRAIDKPAVKTGDVLAIDSSCFITEPVAVTVSPVNHDSPPPI
jgi:hypothetical protein